MPETTLVAVLQYLHAVVDNDEAFYLLSLSVIAPVHLVQLRL